MTLTDFRATRQACDNLASHFRDCWFDDAGNKGFTYSNGFWIIKKPDGTFYTRFGRDEYDSSRLEQVEFILWHNLTANSWL